MTAATTATVSAWVPVIAAAVGAGAALIVGVITQLWSGRRENQRWQRERDDRDAQWHRERQARQEQWEREDSLRWQQARQQAYAVFLSALDEWDTNLRSALASRKNDAALNDRTPLDAAAVDRTRRAAREQLPLVQFMAPKQTRGLARAAVDRREAFWILNLTVEDITVTGLDAGWTKVQQSMSFLLKEMRNDLGLEIAVEDADSGHLNDEAARPKIPADEAPPSTEGS
jgi:hypothetical protein